MSIMHNSMNTIGWDVMTWTLNTLANKNCLATTWKHPGNVLCKLQVVLNNKCQLEITYLHWIMMPPSGVFYYKAA